jgi:hypothetical protein
MVLGRERRYRDKSNDHEGRDPNQGEAEEFLRVHNLDPIAASRLVQSYTVKCRPNYLIGFLTNVSSQLNQNTAKHDSKRMLDLHRRLGVRNIGLECISGAGQELKRTGAHR